MADFEVGDRVRITKAEQQQMLANPFFESECRALAAVDWEGSIGAYHKWPHNQGHHWRVDSNGLYLWFKIDELEAVPDVAALEARTGREEET